MPFSLGFWAAAGGVDTSGQTFELISTQTSSGSTIVFYFNSIPQYYRHLQVRIVGRYSQAAVSRVGSIYPNQSSPAKTMAHHALSGDGSNVSSSSAFNVGNINLTPLTAANAGANNFGSSIIDILDYTSPSKNKTVRMMGGFRDGSGSNIMMRSGFSIDTNPITSLEFSTDDAGVTWAAGTRISLYGIRG